MNFTSEFYPVCGKKDYKSIVFEVPTLDLSEISTLNLNDCNPPMWHGLILK